MSVNVPQPFAPVIDQTLTPNVSMPAGPNGQQNKYISSDIQETLQSGNFFQPSGSNSIDLWLLFCGSVAISRKQEFSR